MTKGGMLSGLKEQTKAVMLFVGLAIISVLGMILLTAFQESTPYATAIVNSTIALFVGALALFGTFAIIFALVIVIKAIVGTVKNMQ